jgi:hypothetical protein
VNTDIWNVVAVSDARESLPPLSRDSQLKLFRQSGVVSTTIIDNPATLFLRPDKTPLQLAIHIRAVGIPASLDYQMDAVLPVEQPLAWPLQEVVQPKRIAPSDIGVYAFQIDQNARIILLPVTIASTRDANPAEPSLAISLRIGAVLNLKWRFVPVPGEIAPYIPADAQDGRLSITLPPAARLPGHLEVRWDEVGTGHARVRIFAIGV